MNTPIPTPTLTPFYFGWPNDSVYQEREFLTVDAAILYARINRAEEVLAFDKDDKPYRVWHKDVGQTAESVIATFVVGGRVLCPKCNGKAYWLCQECIGSGWQSQNGGM